MLLILLSFLAGVLTILTPCSFTILPVILSSSLGENQNKYRPYIIVLSLAISVFVFSILLKTTTLFINIPTQIWSLISGILIILVGLSFLFHHQSSVIINKLGFSNKSNEILNKNSKTSGTLSAVISGMALGPVFSACSITYLLIISLLLPTDIITGTAYLLAYCIGLATILLLVSLGGHALLKRFKWSANPHGRFRKYLGIILLITGILIAFGIDKIIETSLVNTEFTKGIINLENNILQPNLPEN